MGARGWHRAAAPHCSRSFSLGRSRRSGQRRQTIVGALRTSATLFTSRLPPSSCPLPPSPVRLLRCGAVNCGTRREGGLEPKDKGGPPPFPPTKVLSYFDASVAFCDSLESGGALRGSNTRPRNKHILLYRDFVGSGKDQIDPRGRSSLLGS